MTLILDPSLAVICWAHFAPPIGDMFRKSYRKLLRWNDEFPFVKFSLAEDERPSSRAEIPSRRLDGDELGLALARILDVADRLLDESKGWLWIGGGSARPSRPTASRATRVPRRYADRLPAGRGPRRRMTASARARVPPLLDRAGRRRVGLLAARRVAAHPGRRAATPDLTIVSDARYDVQPAHKRVRVTVTLHLANHLKDTTTKRFYFDQAFLAVLPGASGFKLTGGTATPSVSVSKRSANATILRLGLGSRLFSGKSATTRSGSTSSTPAERRPATCGSATRSRRSRSGPTRPTRRPGARSPSSSRPATRRLSRPARSPRRRPTPTGRTVYRAGR